MVKQQSIVFVNGVPGVGKSTISRQTIPHLDNFVYFDKDDVNQAFAGDDRESEFYQRHVRNQSYQVVKALAMSNLSLGKSIWIDAPSISFSEELKGLVEENRFKIIRCITSEETILQRIKERASLRDISKLQDPQNFFHQHPIRIKLPKNAIEIDTSEPIEKIKQQILGFIKS